MTIDPDDPVIASLRGQITDAENQIKELKNQVKQLEQELGQTSALTVYQEVCNSYHAQEGFRAKLLGFLPLASGAGIFFLLNDPFLQKGKQDFLKPFLLPIGLVGAVVTLGLLVFEYRSFQISSSLVKSGKDIETNKLGGINGQFTGHAQVFFKRCHTEFCVTAYNKKVLNSVQSRSWNFLLCAITQISVWHLSNSAKP